MGLSQEQVISLLQQHGVEFQQFQHVPVMTAEAQVSLPAARWLAPLLHGCSSSVHLHQHPAHFPLQTEALKGTNGVVTKNLFIRVSVLAAGPVPPRASCSRPLVAHLVPHLPKTGQEAPAVPDHCTARHQGGPERCGSAAALGFKFSTAAQQCMQHLQHVLPGAFQPRHQQLKGARPAPPLLGAACLPAVLSARLGCGKGGLSWGSEELLAESLQASVHCCAGCVHPHPVQVPASQPAGHPVTLYVSLGVEARFLASTYM